MVNITKKIILEKLSQVIDPELNISITDLGLIYKIKVEKKKELKVFITMTLTTIGCPLFSLIEREIINKVAELGIKKKNIHLDLTFEPPWSPEKMSPSARALLGL